MTGGNPLVGGRAANVPFAATVYVRGSASRVDFRGARGERGLLLHDAGTGKGWIADLKAGVAMPAASAGFADLVVDPEKPCAHMPFSCQPAPARFIAGAARKGWRYRNADGRGPAGTSSGEFWIDGPNGVIVAYRGHLRGLGDTYAFEAVSVSFEPMPPVLFELPEVLELMEPAPERP